MVFAKWSDQEKGGGQFPFYSSSIVNIYSGCTTKHAVARRFESRLGYLNLFETLSSQGGVFFDLRKSALLRFWPTPNPLYYPSDLLARDFKAVIWTCGRSARPPSLSARSRNCRKVRWSEIQWVECCVRRCNITVVNLL